MWPQEQEGLQITPHLYRTLMPQTARNSILFAIVYKPTMGPKNQTSKGRFIC